MPQFNEFCMVVAGGTLYKFWKDVEVQRTYGNPVSECRLTVAEIGDTAHGWKTLRLKPGDPAKVFMAGQIAITGAVAVRQVGYDANTHGVRFIIQSTVADAANGSVDVKPGQFKDYTLTQLANAALKDRKITFSLKGSPEGADKKFPRVSVNNGETPLQFIARLASMRNVHLVDDETGNLVGTRGLTEVVAELQEGRNILQAEMIWRDDQAVDKIKSTGDTHGSDKSWGDEVRAVAALAINPNFNRVRPLTLVAPLSGDKKDMQMYANHEADLNIGGMLTANVTIRGWLRGGSLWLNSVGQNVSLYSPMLLPMDRTTLAIQSVTCRQGDGGTTTVLELVLPRSLGGGNNIPSTGDGGPQGADAAKPLEESA